MGVLDSLTTWTTALVFLAPLLLPRLPGIIAFVQRRQRGSAPSAGPSSWSVGGTHARPTWSTAALALIALHTALQLLRLAQTPANVFRQTGLPLFATPISRLHAALLARVAGPPAAGLPGSLAPLVELPESTLILLQKLQSFDARALYAKLGARTLVGCSWCDVGTPTDYYAFWAADRAVDYLGEVFCWAALTEGARRRRWRKAGVWALALAALAETFWTVTASVQTSRSDGFDVRRPPLPASRRAAISRVAPARQADAESASLSQLHSRLYVVRHAVFLLLPLVLHFLPSAAPQPPTVLSALSALLQSADNLLSHVKLLEVSRAAVSREPTLRSALVRTGTRMEADATYGRTGEGVREAGEAVGLTGEEGVAGGLRDGARRFVDLGRRKVQDTLSRQP